MTPMGSQPQTLILEPERYEFSSGSIHHFDLARREFFKLLGAGIAVFAVATNSRAAQERLGEIATILAAGLLRLRCRKSSPNSPSETDSPLDCEPVFGRHKTGNFEDSKR